jgi:hypothetical protein
MTVSLGRPLAQQVAFSAPVMLLGFFLLVKPDGQRKESHVGVQQTDLTAPTVMPAFALSVVPLPHAKPEQRLLHVTVRWPVALWEVSAPHAEQVRAAVLESALIFSPALHVACVVHAMVRWPVLLWKLSAPHAEQVRAAVLESALIFSPALHVACVMQHEASSAPAMEAAPLLRNLLAPQV